MKPAAHDLAAAMEPVAKHLLGEANRALSSAQELRFGSRGSLSVKPAEGTWFSHETGTGGGVLDLVIDRGKATDRAGAADWLRANGFLIEANDNLPQRQARPRVAATYDYVDEHGEVLFQVCRMEPKDFRQRRPDGNGGWEWRVKGTRQVPYRLPQLLAADPSAPVFILEGEKDADRLAAAGLVATCNAGGAGKWPAALAPFFRGRCAVILPDNDAPGRDHAALVTRALHGVAREVRVLDLAAHWRDMPLKGDVSDWLDRCGTPEQLLALAESASKSAPETRDPDDERDELPEHRKAIAALNENHALALMGDKVVILRETVGERFGKELLYLSTAAFRTWHMNRTVPVEVSDKEGRTTTKHLPLADVWLKSPERRQYEGVTFAPANNAPDCYYNLWSGFTVEPLGGSTLAAGLKCRRLLSHMKYVLCGGNRAHFRYLLAWAADMVQDPDHKKGVALVMRGAKGTGKSTFAEALSELLGRHAMSVSHMRHLTGNFNRHLGDKLLVVAEESYWAGDKADEGPLKHMITSERMTIEAKGVDAVEMPSLCRIMMITNNEWAAPASIDERRYFVLDVSDCRRGDHAYFAALREEMAGDGLRALLALLLRFPLDTVNLRKVPETDALRQQRALSLEPHDQFIFDALCDGALLGQDWDGPVQVGKDELYDAYIDAGRKRGRMHLLAKERFASKFMRATGAISAKLRDGYERRRVYKVPAWEIAAKQFTACCGVDVLRGDNDNDRPF